jgi:hypothetical protein
MTTHLAQILNLAPSMPVDTTEQPTITPAEQVAAEQTIADNKHLIDEVNLAIDKIDLALPMVHDLDTADDELDELADLAREKFTDLMDLGMNIEPRFSGVIFQTAGTLLGHAITAKTAKLDKKLRMIQLQMQKAKLDHQIAKDTGKDADEPIEGEGMVLDRNELLRQILAKQVK